MKSTINTDTATKQQIALGVLKTCYEEPLLYQLEEVDCYARVFRYYCSVFTEPIESFVTEQVLNNCKPIRNEQDSTVYLLSLAEFGEIINRLTLQATEQDNSNKEVLFFATLTRFYAATLATANELNNSGYKVLLFLNKAPLST